jgi:hypothetical protein
MMRSSKKKYIYRVEFRDPPVETHMGISYGSCFEDIGMNPEFFSVYVFSIGEMLLYLSISTSQKWPQKWAENVLERDRKIPRFLRYIPQ